MFHVPWQFRKITEPCIARGPKFNEKNRKHCNIEGTVFSIVVPPSRVGSYFERLLLAKRYPSINGLGFGLMRNGVRNWIYAKLMSAAWDFYGPQFTGNVGTVKCYVGVVQNESYHGVSFFHPRVFEQAIGQFVADMHDEMDGDTYDMQTWYAPEKWVSQLRFQGPAVRFVATRNKKRRPKEDSFEYFMCPIAHDSILCIKFYPNRDFWLADKENKSLDHWLPYEPFQQLMDQIMDSVELTLSPQALAQMKEAQKDLDDASLVSTFPPVNVLEYKRSRESQT